MKELNKNKIDINNIYLYDNVYLIIIALIL